MNAKRTVDQIVEHLGVPTEINPRDPKMHDREDFAKEFLNRMERYAVQVMKEIAYENGYRSADSEQFDYSDPTMRKALFNLGFYIADNLNIGMQDYATSLNIDIDNLK